MQIDWWTLALQVVNFLVLVWLLRRFLYRPVREVIEKRKLLAEQAFAEAAAKQTEADAARQRFEQDRAQLAKDRQDMLKQLHETLEFERHSVMQQAREDADKMLAETRENIDDDRKAAFAEMRGQVAALATEMASEILAKTSSSVPADVFMDQLAGQLKALPEEERERLKQDLEAEEGNVTVVTAAPLEPENRNRWAERLSSSLGCACKTDFRADPTIVGGAELRFPHAVLTFTYADLLAKARDLVREDDVNT